MAEYFMDKNNGRFGSIWKKEGFEEYYYSEKTFTWLKSTIVMIMPDFFHIDEDYANEIISKIKESGPVENEVVPFRYFLSNLDYVYAEDMLGNCYFVNKDKTLRPAPYGTVDCMWGGIDEKDIDFYLK